MERSPRNTVRRLALVCTLLLGSVGAAVASSGTAEASLSDCGTLSLNNFCEWNSANSVGFKWSFTSAAGEFFVSPADTYRSWYNRPGTSGAPKSLTQFNGGTFVGCTLSNFGNSGLRTVNHYRWNATNSC